MDYNATINLPKTDFSMRANLPQKEPAILERWERMKLYEGIMARNEGKPTYILHDGPPYANGDIHTGHAFNKCLKDFVVRYKNQSGFRSPYVPGWDTHGLPIESQAIKKLGINRNEVSASEFRKICEDFARGYVDNQRTQFKRLGVLGYWDHPYLTLEPEFEARQIEVFGEMAKKGYIYKGLKPVYWCAHDETALAEAEIEYQDDTVTTAYVNLEVVDDKGKLFTASGLGKINVVIWTTAIWTIPASSCVCLGPDIEYGIYEKDGVGYLMANSIASEVLKLGGIEDAKLVYTISGQELVGVTVKDPVFDGTEPIIVGSHVTADDGTGCVHTAYACGPEDFEICEAFKDQFPEMTMRRPVDSRGFMTADAGPEFEGLNVWDSNEAIRVYLEKKGLLYATRRFTHSYPHCWRCKEPVLFRVTEQWFCSVEDFKDEALRAIANVKWYPSWGEERISSMVRDRSDWCISRQRLWGVPIPIFYCKHCGKPIINDESIKAVADLFRKEGSNGWYNHEAAEILPAGFACECGATEFIKETDIMDVWFDSGSSHFGVLEMRPELSWPCDMYLEGNDQHRGWFQSSLLTSVAVRGVAPYREVLTCGMVVDGEGKKMSKSLGNGIDPTDIEKQYGADILRLWSASSDYASDIRISPEILKQLSEVYRKIRNTARYILGNTSDFDPKQDLLPWKELEELDRWALVLLNRMLQKAIDAYESYAYHVVYHTIYNFCVVDMSNFYLDIIKDRLYCEKADSKARRSAQSAMFLILDALTRLLAPILSFTAEEIWQSMSHQEGVDPESVNYNEVIRSVPCEGIDEEKWAKLMALRDDAKKALELARGEKLIGAALEAEVTLFCSEETYPFLKANEALLPTLFITSAVKVEQGEGPGHEGEAFPGVKIAVSTASGEKCERCWKISTDVGSDPDHPTLCPRCAAIVKSL
ncbi:MAG: isoleucine--tRNA ligase [Clostridia bacterium]|nr:isoleucine--tRNA ligase [Clostridia bacterium]